MVLEKKTLVLPSGTTVIFFKSSLIEFAIHDKTSLILVINNEWYKYEDVPESIIEEFIEAESQGTAFHELIKNKYVTEKIVRL